MVECTEFLWNVIDIFIFNKRVNEISSKLVTKTQIQAASVQKFQLKASSTNWDIDFFISL